MVLLTHMFNRIFITRLLAIKTCLMATGVKLSQIIPIPKPGKDLTEVTLCLIGQ